MKIGKLLDQVRRCLLGFFLDGISEKPCAEDH